VSQRLRQLYRHYLMPRFGGIPVTRRFSRQLLLEDRDGSRIETPVSCRFMLNLLGHISVYIRDGDPLTYG
jgi:hypothetical protein